MLAAQYSLLSVDNVYVVCTIHIYETRRPLVTGLNTDYRRHVRALLSAARRKKKKKQHNLSGKSGKFEFNEELRS